MGTITICSIKEIDYIDEIIDQKYKKMPYVFKWIIYNYKKIFKVFTIKKVGDIYVIIIPCYAKSKKTLKLIPQLNNILYDKNINTIILSKTLKNQKGIQECFNKENINILNGNTLKQAMIIKILEYISNEINKNIKVLDVTILANDNKMDNIRTIMDVAENVKNIKIVTNNIEKFNIEAQKLQEKYGMLIRVTNNKRRGLSNSKIIINLDFPEEILNKYTINPEAIIVNLDNIVKIKSKAFKGININNIQIVVNEKYKTEFEKNTIYYDFDEKELYEASIYGIEHSKAKSKIEKDNVHIKNLIGNNGIINSKEFEEKCEFYVKSIDKT